MMIGIERFSGGRIVLFTKYASDHTLTRHEARALGRAMIRAANLADRLDERDRRDAERVK